MYPLKRLMVCLDHSDLDNTLIEYTSWLAEKLGSESVYFVHVSKRFEYPKNFKEKFPEMVIPGDEVIKNEIEENVNVRFKNDVKLNVEVREGNFTETIMRFIELKQVDLIIVGKRNDMGSAGYNARRIANMASCSVMFVPERAVGKSDKVFVPVNFSDLSAMSLQLAGEISEPDDSIVLQNIYKVPNGYRYSGKSFDEFAQVMKKHSEEEYAKFLSTNNLDGSRYEIDFTLVEVGKSSDGIFKYLVKISPDLLILGSRGRTSAASFILGSTAVGLLRPDNKVPFIIVKQKGQNMDIFGAFREF